MTARAARLGFFAYAACRIGIIVSYIIIRSLLDRMLASKDYGHYSNVISVLHYGTLALAVGTAFSLVAIGQLPRSVRARGLAHGALAIAVFGLLLDVIRETHHATSSDFEHWNRISISLINVLALGSAVLFFLIARRVARAANDRYLAVAAIVVLATEIVLALIDLGTLLPTFPKSLFPVASAAYYLTTVLEAALAVWLGIATRRITSADGDEASDAPLAPGWRRVANGIGLYLVAAVARVALAIVSVVVLANARTSSSFGELHAIRDNVITIGVLGALASIVMLAGVAQIARAPTILNAGGYAAGALAGMTLGALLDAGATYILSDAFSGSVSSAFFAVDALPVLAALTTACAVGSGWMLLQALRSIAIAIDLPADASRAAGAGVLLVAGGLGGAGLQLLAKVLPLPIFIVGALVVLPLVLIAAVQLLRVMLAVAASIRARTST